MYKLTYKITVGKKEIAQVLQITQTEVLIEIAGKKFVFIKELNQYYQLNPADENLTLVDNTDIMFQIEKVRELLDPNGAVLIEENAQYNGYVARVFEFESTNAIFSITSKIITATVPGISETAYKAYQDFEAQTQLVDIHYTEGEIMAYNKSEVATPQGIQVQEIELVSVEKSDCTEAINTLLCYKMEQ
jgi:hypothetical protein